MNITLDFENKTSIYRQIESEIKRNIAEGKLQQGDKLPTVRELAEELNLAKGTVKHAYEELHKEGIIDMRQGRGTFIAFEEEKPMLSRKDQAMDIIDHMIEKLHGLNFSLNEIEIYFKLKMTQWDGTAMQQVKITVIDCNPEALSIMTWQIEKNHSVEVYRLLLDDITKNPVSLGDEVDIVVTTHTHMPQVLHMLKEQEKAVAVVLSPAQKTIVDIAKLPEHTNICIITASRRFAEIVSDGCMSLNNTFRIIDSLKFGGTEERFIIPQETDVVIVPPRYLTFCSSNEERIIREFSKKKQIIVYEYQVDRGSMLYLQNRIDRVRERK